MQTTAATSKIPAPKIPATVVTGFLGAGKTTLIRHLITNANGRRIALIVNEFGEVGIDGDLLKSCGAPDCTEDDIVELANGCLCCSVKAEFVQALEALLDADGGHSGKFDYVLVETTGKTAAQSLCGA